MKIITDNAAYVQKKDIAYLSQTNIARPISIFLKVFDLGAITIDENNKNEFIKFDSQKDISFFRNIDWIIDYNEVKDLSEKEIIELGQSIAKEKNSIAQKYNAMEIEEKAKNMNLVSQYELLDFKMNSLQEFYWFKHGHIDIKLPEGIDLPTRLKKETGIKK